MKFSLVPIVQAGGGTSVLIAAAAGSVQHLMALVGAIGANGTVVVVDSDGTGLTGLMTLAAGVPLVMIHPTKDTAPAATAGKGISLTTTQAFNGYAVIGTES